MEIAYWIIAALFLYGWIGKRRNAPFGHFVLGLIASALWPVTIGLFALLMIWALLFSKRV